MRKQLDWKFIQNEYDSGLSYRDLTKKHGISQASMFRAKKLGLFIPRSPSDGCKLFKKLNPEKIKHSEKTKQKLSIYRKKYLKEHPEKAPYLLNHYSHGDSYPETYFKEVFEKENIPLQFHKQIGLYELDFYNETIKLDIEIDGEQHYVDKRIVESDIKRTNYLVSLGWRVYRIRWSEYQKLSFEKRKQIIQEIRDIIK